MSNFINSFWFDSGFDYSDIYGALTLRELFTWNNAVIQLRRSSDDATAHVFFDGSGGISGSSLISTSSDTTPSATTLSTWVGSDDAYIAKWQYIHPDGIINNSVISIPFADQAKFITSGVIETENGKPAPIFDGTDSYSGIALTEFDSGNTFSVFTVSSNNTSSNLSCILSTSSVSNNRFSIFNDRNTSKFISFIRVSPSVSYSTTYLSQQNISDQKLLSTVIDSSNMDAWYNGTSQNSDTWSGSYDNQVVRVGADVSGGLTFNGNIQEIIIYDADKTSNISSIHADINNYYSIY